MSTGVVSCLADLSVKDICPRNKWVNGNQRRECYSCKMVFSVTKRRHHCRLCGEVVCSTCSQKFKLFQQRKFFTIKTRICMICVHTKEKKSQNFPSSEVVTVGMNKHSKDLYLQPQYHHSLSAQSTARCESNESTLFIWLTVWVGFAVFCTAIYEVFDWQYRIVVITSLYLLYILAFTKVLSGQPKSLQLEVVSHQTPSIPTVSESPPLPSTIIFASEGYAEYVARLVSALQYYTTPNSDWKLLANRENVFYYRMAIPKAAPVHKVIAFIPSLKINDFLDIMDTRNKLSRQAWDENMNDYQELEDHGNLSIYYNSQNSFLGGVIAPRDFCLMSYRTESTYCNCSIEHKAAPIRKSHIRGHIHFSGMKCEEAILEGQCGFWITYVNHVDIKGSLPRSMVTNGTMEMMIKFIKLVQEQSKMLRK